MIAHSKKQQQEVNNYTDQFLKCIKIRQNQTRHHREKYEEDIFIYQMMGQKQLLHARNSISKLYELRRTLS